LNLLARQSTKEGIALESAMNHSLHSADRATHLKIVVMALIGATMVAGVGITARLSGQGPDATLEARVPVIKAGAPVAISSSETRAIR
jgi:hypothetical protein